MPPRWKELVQGDAKVPAVKGQLEENKKVMQVLQDNLSIAQNHIKQQADQHRTEREFEIVDWVFVRLQPYKQLPLRQQEKNKLSPKFFGPYQIIRKISPVAYELKLPDKSRIHNVFHVSNLKKLLGQHETAETTLPSLGEEGKFMLELEAIINTRERRLRSCIIKEYLIKWKFFPEEDVPEEDASLETKKFIQQYSSLPCL